MATYRIALLGDTIFAAWNACDELGAELRRLFPRTEFEIFNHGVKGSRVGYGLHRVSNGVDVDGVRRDSLAFENPHIVVVESFAYTQRADGPEGLTEYRDLLRAIWDELEATTQATRLFALAPPPVRDKYGSGVPELINTSRAARQRMADDTRLYLDEARRIAQDEHWPLADIYAEVEARVRSGEGARRFVNGNDNISPSRYGFETMARVLVQAMDDYRMIEEKKEH